MSLCRLFRFLQVISRYCLTPLLGSLILGCQARPTAREVPLDFPDTQHPQLRSQLRQMNLEVRADCDPGTVCVSAGYYEGVEVEQPFGWETLIHLPGVTVSGSDSTQAHLSQDWVIEASFVDLGKDTVIYTHGHDLKIAGRKVTLGQVVTADPTGLKPPGSVLIVSEELDLVGLNTSAPAQECLESQADRQNQKSGGPLTQSHRGHLAAGETEPTETTDWHSRVCAETLDRDESTRGSEGREGIQLSQACGDANDFRFALKPGVPGWMAELKRELTPVCGLTLSFPPQAVASMRQERRGQVNHAPLRGGDILLVTTSRSRNAGWALEQKGSPSAGVCPGRPPFVLSELERPCVFWMPDRIRVLPTEGDSNRELPGQSFSLAELRAWEPEYVTLRTVRWAEVVREVKVENGPEIVRQFDGLNRPADPGGAQGTLTLKQWSESEWIRGLPGVLKGFGLVYP